MGELLIAGLFMVLLGFLLSAVLAVANLGLFVYEDPRINDVEEMLPATNCGACGLPGCRVLAEAVVGGEAAPGKCTVSSPDTVKAVADFLGVDAGVEEKRVARLACAGGSHVAWTRARYEGLDTCRGAALISGGGKGCSWGCLGLGDCEDVCDCGAISIDSHGLPIVDEASCTACNACIEVCPKQLFSLHPISHRLWVACKNLAMGEEAEAECEVACNACGRCAADAPGELVAMEDNLAVVDYSKNHLASKAPTERCPTGAIVWLEPDGKISKGQGARKVTRKTALRVVAAPVKT
ncbi:MAG: (Fe-S)-binding protein [Candidatus Hydrogenedentes bacterium]|jgi:Na+-translocating ferredoxin:NAD+ oxidoreductase RNF subunit RnfB|nr:(Fe-S)-binding protein [Candidatus Hydrogenedentota bacterium]